MKRVNLQLDKPCLIETPDANLREEASLIADGACVNVLKTRFLIKANGRKHHAARRQMDCTVAKLCCLNENSFCRNKRLV